MVRTIRAAGLAAVAALGLTGCGGNMPVRLPETGATLEGEIRYGGEELQFAMVMVRSAGGSATGSVGEDGRYKVENVPLGEVQVGVVPKAAYSNYMTAVMRGGAYQGPDAKPGRKKVGLKFTDVPDKFYDPETSGLRTTVEKGTNTFDITIPKTK